MCPVLYRNMFDVLHSLLDATPLIRDGYEISFVCLKNQLNHQDAETTCPEDNILEEWTEQQWMDAAAGFWTGYTVYATPMVGVRIRCNFSPVSFRTFNLQLASFYQKTVNREKMLLRSTIYITDDQTDIEPVKMILTIELHLATQILDGYCDIMGVEPKDIDSTDIEQIKTRTKKKSKEIQPAIRYLIWLEKETAQNPEENLKFTMDGLYHKYAQYSEDKSYQFVFKAEPKDGRYSLPELKCFIMKQFLEGLDTYGFRPWDSSHTIEIYILDGGAFMTDDMKNNPMNVGTVEINSLTLPVKIGFMNEEYELYPCGRRKKFRKLENYSQMYFDWVHCKTGVHNFF